MFGFLDVAIIILAIVCVTLGAYRGFIGSIAKLLGGFLKLVVAILITKPVASIVRCTKLDEQMFDKLSARFGGISEKFNVNLVGMNEEQLNVFVNDALSDAKIPKLFRGFFKNVFSISPETIAIKESVTMADLMGVTVGNVILLVATFLVLIVLIWIVSKIILKWSKKKNKSNTVLGKTNKFLGGVFGLLRAAVIVFIAFICLSVLSNFSFMNNAIEYVENSFIAGPLYGLSKELLETSFDFKSALEKWIIK